MPLMDRIQHKTAVIGVIGLGYVGLPLAIAFAREGFNVEGYDIQVSKVMELRRGHTAIEGVIPEELIELRSKGKLNCIYAMHDTWDVDVVIICVPTPITKDKKPDLSYIINSTNRIKDRLPNKDMMVILGSSTYPGTTRDVVLPILSGSVKYIAYSPERIDPGSKEYRIRNTPKLVGGINKKSTVLATKLYSYIVDNVCPVSSLEVAETAKLFENVFRNVNIALVNELALICEQIGVSVWKVIDAAATKPFGFMPFYPGPGVGGHCIGTDDYYLIDKARACGYQPELDVIALSINETMPSQVAKRVASILRPKEPSIEGAKILVLGIAFKRDVGDTRESPAIKLLEILTSWGADVIYNDPYVPDLSNRIVSVELTDECLETADCVVIATDHSCYDYQRIVDKAKLVFDTRNATKGIVNSSIHRLGEKGD